MKHLIILLTALACLTSCRNIRGKRDKVQAKEETVYVRVPVKELDSLLRPEPIQIPERDSIMSAYQTISERLAAENKALQRRVDSMQITSDTLAARLLHARLIIENARYYLRIANRNASQQKFLRGWMNRALEVQ